MLTHTGKITHSVSLRSDCRKQGLSLDGPRCRDLMLPLSVPPVPISRGRTVIYDIVEYIIMEWTVPNESRIWRICRRVCRVLILKKEEECSWSLVRLPQSSIGQSTETYYWTQKTRQGRLRGRQVLFFVF